jgi:cytochrome c oxidase assembly factor 6
MQAASKREVCYAARDAYFQCLDRTGDLEACTAEDAKFKESCPLSWVSYFTKQREREMMIESQIGRARQRLGKE